MDNYQYHLTFNGKFTNETYIEYFNPNCLDKYLAKVKEKQTPDIDCAEAIKNLKEAVKGNSLTEEKCEQTFRKLHDMLCDDQCRSEKKPCNGRKESGICEEQKESENLYFHEEYQKAVDIIIEMIKEWLCASDKTDLCQRIKCQWDNLPKNNRILFHGQRGCGKTSVTMSVAKSLEGFGIGGYTFKVLPIINPGYFDDDTNILKTIISNMFEMAKCIIKKDECEKQMTEHEDVLKQFEEVYRLLGCIESPNKEKHTLEALNEISKASGMREAMQKLVNKFIKILPCKAKCLVLVIDDVDMSVAYAATMLEQINKFLELDNLLILISANLDQLHNEMREHYSKAFERTLRDKNQALSIDVEDLASKYLLKLFPTSNRINVERPVSQLLQTELIINNEKRDDLQKVLLSLIWEKTRLLYIPKDENTLHPIIPTNLRELAQLINLLQGMKEVKVGENKEKQMLFADLESYENCRNNINEFKNYFLNIWVPTHLAVNEEEVFKNIPSDITEINKHLINSINIIGTDNKKSLMSREVDLDIIERNAEGVYIDRDIYTMVSPNDPRFVKANKISDIFNQPSNYSYGDLLLMIDKYETYFESEENRRFTNAIKIYYSILLFETMFFNSNSVVYNKEKWLAGINDENPEKAWDALCRQAIPIQKLIGGTVYYPNYFEIITSNYFTQKGPSFDAKRAFYHKLEAKEKDKIGLSYPLFSVLYYGDIRPDRSETKHIYDTTYDSNADVDGTKFVTFDILSILSNMLNPWHTISRLDDSTRCFNWEKGIESWGDYCTILGSDIAIPNSILPLYSVDAMLLILKNQISDVEVAPDIKIQLGVLKDTKRIIDAIRDVFFNYDKIIDLINNEKLKIEVDYDPEIEDTTSRVEAIIEKKVIIDEKEETENTVIPKSYYDLEITVLEKNGLTSIIKVNECLDPTLIVMASGKEKRERSNPSLFGAVIKNVQTIILPLIECYWILTNRCSENEENYITEKISLPDRFRDHCIAIILSGYRGGKKDREALIKGLKKQNTISEMYKYLVDQLWENAATEALIRNQIQIRIRKKNNVYHYYDKSLKLLKRYNNSDQQAVYESVFNIASGLFINDSNC